MGANGKKEAQELVKRCEAVGWQVVRSGSDHFKVDTRRGTFVIPGTPDDYRSMRNSLADAKRFGLEDLEAKLLAQTEKARLERIVADRAANDAKMAKIRGAYDAKNPFTPPKEPDDTVDTDTNLGEVNGVRIAAVAPVRYVHPRSGTGNLSTLRNGEELLLVDDRVVFRCVNTLPDGKPCHATFDNALSLLGHSRRHPTEKENETVAVKPTPADAAKAAASSNGQAPSSMATTRELLVTTIEELAGSIFEIGGKLIETRNSLIKMADQVKQLKPEVVQVEPDPEILAKAAKYDAMRGLLQ